MQTIKIKTREYLIATAWNEISSDQLTAIVKLFENRQLEVQAAQIELLGILTGIGTIEMWYNGYAAIEDLLHLTEFIFQENLLTRNLVKEYDGYYGPADDFNNLQVAEFYFIDDLYGAYKLNPDLNQEYLDKMVAALFRPIKSGYNLALNPDGDPREPFNENVIDYHAKATARWPRHLKLGILHWYEGCKGSLAKQNPEIFSGKGGDPAKHGLWSVMRSVADKGIHGDMVKVERMFLKTFMMELTEVMEEARKLEQSIQQQKK